MKNAIQVQDQILKSLGAKEVYHKPIEQFAGAGHIMGTCRMGNDPKESVIDRYQRSHDHKNMFIVGSSIFPTVGASNPTLTIAALSLWAADSINKQLNGM
jgi:choline dehydrogenase-like flavoprotein